MAKSNKLLDAFNELGISTEINTADDLKEAIEQYAAESQEDAPVYVYQPPRLSVFSGEKEKDTPFDVWVNDVKCLRKEKGHSAAKLKQAIRRSLRGPPARVVLNLGDQATIDDIIDKLEIIYGTIDSTENLMSAFYACRQEEIETVAEYSSRLENIWHKAVLKEIVRPSDTNTMLRQRFWSGLKSRLKDVSRHTKEKCKTFQELQMEMKAIEVEHEIKATEKKTAVAKVAVTPREEAEDLKSMVKQLSTQMSQLQQEVKQMKTQPVPRYQTPRLSANQFTPQRFSSRQPSFFPRQLNRTPQGFPAQPSVLICWICGQEGHRKHDCPNRHNSHSLNRKW